MACIATISGAAKAVVSWVRVVEHTPFGVPFNDCAGLYCRFYLKEARRLHGNTDSLVSLVLCVSLSDIASRIIMRFHIVRLPTRYVVVSAEFKTPTRLNAQREQGSANMRTSG